MKVVRQPKLNCEPDDEGRRKGRAKSCSGVYDANAEGPLFLGEPFGNPFDGCRPMPTLTQAENEPECAQTEEPAGRCLGCFGDRPDSHRDREPTLGADSILQFAKNGLSERVGEQGTKR